MLIRSSNSHFAEQDRPVIEYPCRWSYKVIGEDCTLLKAGILDACAPHKVDISYSHSSSKGKYHSLNAELTVPDETTRLAIFDQLKNHPSVKFVL